VLTRKKELGAVKITPHVPLLWVQSVSILGWIKNKVVVRYKARLVAQWGLRKAEHIVYQSNYSP
jgi:hypothetical protein